MSYDISCASYMKAKIRSEIVSFGRQAKSHVMCQVVTVMELWVSDPHCLSALMLIWDIFTQSENFILIIERTNDWVSFKRRASAIKFCISEMETGKW